MVTHLYGILGVILDRTFGNIIRMLRVIRLPKEERGHLSWTFVGTLAVILAYGLIMMFSASYSSGYTNHGGNIYYFIKPQAIVAAVGFVVMLGRVASSTTVRCGICSETFYVITLALLVLALFMPSDNNGCYRWVYLPGRHVAAAFGAGESCRHPGHGGYSGPSPAGNRKACLRRVCKPALPADPRAGFAASWNPTTPAMLLMCAMIFATMLVCAGRRRRMAVWRCCCPGLVRRSWRTS